MSSLNSWGRHAFKLFEKRIQSKLPFSVNVRLLKGLSILSVNSYVILVHVSSHLTDNDSAMQRTELRRICHSSVYFIFVLVTKEISSD